MEKLSVRRKRRRKRKGENDYDIYKDNGKKTSGNVFKSGELIEE